MLAALRRTSSQVCSGVKRRSENTFRALVGLKVNSRLRPRIHAMAERQLRYESHETRPTPAHAFGAIGAGVLNLGNFAKASACRIGN
jgi:hypothetical protein